MSFVLLKSDNKSTTKALRFVVLVGVLSFFADLTYEGSRSIVGPYLALLGASAATISIVTGFGEFAGYGLRVFSGKAADATQEFWPIAILGYGIQMSAVPLLAFAHSWQTASLLIILERIGKAVRNPPRDVMLSHAGRRIGYGWAFGLHEALDQFGALVGPLMMSLILALKRQYDTAFLTLAIPAVACFAFVLFARAIYPHPETLEPDADTVDRKAPRMFWVYFAACGLVAAGFVDYPLVAFHLQTKTTVAADMIPVFYAVAMGVGGVGSLFWGKLFDRCGFSVLIWLTAITAWFAPLLFFGTFWPALAGAVLWGLGIGVHESIMPAAIAPLVSSSKRASAYGIFNAGYGLFWFLGSVAIGLLYERSLLLVTIFCITLELAAIPILIFVRYAAATSSGESC